jgi:iron complex transport system substrate-binding protein
MTRLRRAALLASLLMSTAVACGSDDEAAPDTSSVAATDAPAEDTTDVPESADVPATDVADTGAVTTEGSGADTTHSPAGDAPTRIVSLSPSATEILFAIGAGDQVIAVDDQSNYPEEASDKMTDLSGFTPNIEAIAGYEPDLVVHDGTQELSALEGLGIATYAGVAPQSLDDVYLQVEELGALTGHPEQAREVVAQMQQDIETARESVSVLFDVAPRIYHELDNTFFSANSNTFIGQIYGLFGLHNIADTAEGGTDYPQLSAEFVISQNPDIIFLADANYGETPELVAARPGWSEIAAVQNGHVIPVDADVASRWGPRIVQYVELVAGALNELASAPAG